MTIKSGFSATKVSGGETVPDFTTEKAGSTTIAKMMKESVELLTRSKVKGVGGVVGTYDDDVIGEACFRLFYGSHIQTVYGMGLNVEYFHKLKIL